MMFFGVLMLIDEETFSWCMDLETQEVLDHKEKRGTNHIKEMMIFPFDIYLKFKFPRKIIFAIQLNCQNF